MAGDRSGARWLITIGLATALLSAQGRVSPSAPGDEDVGGRRAARNRVIVKFRDSAAPGALAQIERDTDADERRGIGGRGAVLIHSRRHRAAELVSMLARRADVEYAEPDYVAYQSAGPNDPLFANQWALRNVGQTVNGVTGTPGADVHAPAAWDIATGSTSTVIGITDGGFDYTVFDLVPNVWSMPADMPVTMNGQTITCPAGTHGFESLNGAFNCDPVFNGGPTAHATHVAGIAGAAGNNQEGIAGVNRQASLMSLNFFGASSQGFYSDAINVIEFAVQVKLKFGGAPGANVRVLNASWGGPSFSQALQDEIDRAGASDILLVAAAMNSSQNLDATPEYPASFNRPNMLVVASTNSSDQLSSFSNYGPNTVHLAAPGENILSTLATAGYGYMSGTSMATPLVSGAAALALSRCPLDTAGVKSLLLNSVDHLSQLAGKTMTGGRLNIANALQTCAAGAADASPSVTLTAPADATAYAEPASIALAASASDTDGTIARVDFHAGSTLIGTVTAPPYTATWSGVPAGMYVLTAVAVDNAGMQSSSHTVRVSVASSGANGSLPQPWQNQDIGAVGTPGTASYTGPTFAVQGAGSGIGAASGDAFQYTYQSIVGDGEIVARVASTQNTASGARAGIVLRQDLSETSPDVLLAVQPDGSVVLSRRQFSGEDNVSIASAMMSAPVWLKLTRRVSTVTGYVSADNVTWIRVGQTSLNGPPGYGGLAVTSGDAGQLNASTFDRVAVVGGAAPQSPGMPNNPIPRHGATGVFASGVIPSWDASGATSYDVRFGTTNPPPVVSSGQTDNWYTPASVKDGRTYFWQIVAHNSTGATTGPMWTFTTAGSASLPASDIVIYASDLAASARHGAWTSASDATAAAGLKLLTPDNGVSNTSSALASPTDYVDVTFNANAGTLYAFWMRLQALNNNKFNDSVWVQFSDAQAGGSPAYPLNTASGLCVNLPTDGTAASLNGWGWQNGCYWLSQATTVSFSTSGTHTMRIQVREDGVQFDQIVLSPSTYSSAAPGPVTNDHTIVPKPDSGTSPGPPASPSPENGATVVSTTPTLTWSAANAASYDVNFGTVNPPPAVSTAQASASYTPATLANSTAYFWQIVAHNSAGATAGPVWSFSTVASSGGSLPSPWQNQDVGSTGLRGNAPYSGGTFTVSGAGADIWGTSDAFQFVYQPIAGDGQIVARVTSIQNTNAFAKAGIMLRETTAAGSAHVILDVKPDGNIEFMTRPATGAATTYIAGALQPVPAWLKLARTGATVTASVSANGSSWTTVGSTAPSIASTALFGLAVTSHDTTKLNTSTFDNVTVGGGASSPSDIVIYASDLAPGARHGSWTSASDATAPAATKLVTPDNGWSTTDSVLASPTDYVDVTFSAVAGVPYTVWLRLQALNNNKYNDSLWLQFSDARANGSPVYSMNTASGLCVNLSTDVSAASLNGWGWQNGCYWLSQATTVTFASSGTHTMRIQLREDGVQFDQIVLSPKTYATAAPGPVTNDHTIVPK